jgi:hypothetical protein
MMGMGQQMPMRRPQMGPSPMTAGRPNPMAGFQGYGQWGAGAPPRMPPSGGPPAQQQWGGGPQMQGSMGSMGGPQMTPGFQGGGQWYGGAPPQMPPSGGPPAQQQWGGGGGPQGYTPQVAYPQGGSQGSPWSQVSDAQMHPYAPRNQGAQFQPMQQPPPGAMGGPAMPLGQVAQAAGGMSDAAMHPFAPRNRRPQFPGAAQGGIMQGMGNYAGARWV